MNQFKNLSDRDLLIQNITETKNLCNKFDSFSSDNSKEHDLIFNRLSSLLENKVSNKLFYFTISIVIMIIISLTAYLGNIKDDVTKNNVTIEQLQKNRNFYKGF